MKLFLISQEENINYGKCDSAVVCAHDEDDARTMAPDGVGGSMADFSLPCPMDGSRVYGPLELRAMALRDRVWCSSADEVTVKYLGEAADGLPLGVVCASFYSEG